MSYLTKITAEAHKETKHIKWTTPKIPWKPQCGENQQRGASIMGFQENLQ
jgi:hypothetical protein